MNRIARWHATGVVRGAVTASVTGAGSSDSQCQGDCPLFIVNLSGWHPPCASSRRPGGPATPRTRRFAPTEYAHHVINRGNDRRRIFFQGADYERFLHLLSGAKRRYPVKLFGVCLMPNHFHALIQPQRDGALSAYLRWVLGCYACNLRSRTRTVGHGHVFQRRFWSAGVEDTYHFLSVLRYIEANPVRAGLVTEAELWPWSSVALRGSSRGLLLDQLPVALPAEWSSIVNAPQSRLDLDALRRTQQRGRPADAARTLPAIELK